MGALAERRMPSFGSGEGERPWTGVSGPWVHKWRASKKMGFVRGVRSAGYILGLAPGSSTHRCWRGGRSATQLEGGSGFNQLHGIGDERAQLIDDTPDALDRRTGVGLLASGRAADGRGVLGGIDGVLPLVPDGADPSDPPDRRVWPTP